MDKYKIVEAKGVIGLAAMESAGGSLISVEFPTHLSSARGRSELASQPLIRAIGRNNQTVIDATAGMGQDSFMMAVHGYDVVGYERSETVATLLQNGLSRSMADPEVKCLLDQRLQFIHGDAIVELGQLERPPQVVYLDPMYPPKRKKSALAKKEMHALRDLVGEDPDSLMLFRAAMQVAQERVVVKRPHYAEPLIERPSMSYQGKLVRFDVYLTKFGSWE